MPKTKYTVKNLLWGPITVELKGGPKTLKPRETQIVELDEDDLKSVGFQRSLREQKIFVRAETEKKPR